MTLDPVLFTLHKILKTQITIMELFSVNMTENILTSLGITLKIIEISIIFQQI